jgi:hypothetical protein
MGDMKLSQSLPSYPWPAYKRRECPRNGRENEHQRYCEPNKYCFVLQYISGLSFCFCGTKREHSNCQDHHENMLHTEETDLALMYRSGKVLPEIAYDGTDKVEHQANDQLGMRNNDRQHTRYVIALFIKCAGAPLKKGIKDCKEQRGQNQPTKKRVNNQKKMHRAHDQTIYHAM